MRLSADLSYPADVATVAALLSDEEFLRRRAEQAAADGGGIDQVDLTGSLAEGFTTIVRRTMSTSIIPAQLRPFVGDHLLVRQTEVWEPLSDDRMVGTVAVEITGVPVRVTGTMVLEPAEGGSHQVYDGEIKASVPLFGGIVEDATSGAIRATLDAEAAATVDRLQSNG